MALSYNLKFRKLNLFQKVLLEKEGEIVVDRHAFRLKGKGANDQGELIYFADIKDLTVNGDDQLEFTTFQKERFVLSSFSNLFESFLKDFYRVRNEFLAENLLMKVGMLVKEYDGAADVIDANNKVSNKGFSRLQFYEGSLVVIPEMDDAFAIYYNFLKHHEFDEDDYVLRLSVENGETVQISKLGTSFEDAQETLEMLLGKMYQRVMNFLQEYFVELSTEKLLKLATLMREGKSVPFNTLRKIDENLPLKFQELFTADNPLLQDKIAFLLGMNIGAILQGGLHFAVKPDGGDLLVKGWFVVPMPMQRILAVGISGVKDFALHFFRVDEDGEREEKIAERVLELNQAMLLLRFDISIFYRDKWELKKSKFKTALRKLSFLRALRMAYLGKSVASTSDVFQKDLDLMKQRALLPPQSFVESGKRPMPYNQPRSFNHSHPKRRRYSSNHVQNNGQGAPKAGSSVQGSAKPKVVENKPG